MVFHLLGMFGAQLMEDHELDKKKQDAKKMSKADFIKKWGKIHREGAKYWTPLETPMGEYYDKIKRETKGWDERESDALKLSKEAFVKKHTNILRYIQNHETIFVTRKKYEELWKKKVISKPPESIKDTEYACGLYWDSIRKNKE